MSARTRTHRPASASPRYTKRHGIGRDRLRWDSSRLGTFRHTDQTTAAGIDPPPASTPTDTGSGR